MNHPNNHLFDRGILESGESLGDVYPRLLSAIRKVDSNYFTEKDTDIFCDLLNSYMHDRRILLSTSILANLGKRTNLSLASCTAIRMPVLRNEIDKEKLLEVITSLASSGVGVGVDLSAADDPLGLYKIIEKRLLDIDRHNKRNKIRPVACILTIDINHPRSVDLIKAKNRADFSKSRCNISVKVQSEMLQELLHADGISGQSNKLIDTICASIHACGEPGIIISDRYESKNPIKGAPYESFAPCAEIGLEDDDYCFFGTVNVSEFVGEDGFFDWDNYIVAIRVLTRALDSVLDCFIECSPFGSHKVKLNRRIGVGITGFASLLEKLDVSYASEGAYELANGLCEYLDFFSKKESLQLARIKSPFPSFVDSKYLDRDWFWRKLSGCNDKGFNLDWDGLFSEIKNNGLRNSTTTAFPPTGNTSLILGVSYSFEPMLPVPVCAVNSCLNKNSLPLLCGSEVLSVDDDSCAANWHIKLTSVFQNWSDGGASKTLTIKNDSTPDDVKRILFSCLSENLNSISLFREGCLGVDFRPIVG